MNRSKISIVILIALIVSLGISFHLSISHNVAQGWARRNLINQVFFSFKDVSLNVNVIIDNIEAGLTDGESNRGTIFLIIRDLLKVDAMLKRYPVWFPNERLYYGGFPDFDHIAYTLDFGSGTVNEISYNCILLDNAISENEFLYLSALGEHTAIIVNAMLSTENPLQENPDISIAQLNGILNDFFIVWSWSNENSPFLLLRSE